MPQLDKYELLQNSPDGDNPLGPFQKSPYKQGLFFSSDPEYQVIYPDGKKSVVALRFRLFLSPIKARATIEPENREMFEKMDGWYTDIEVFDSLAMIPLKGENLFYHRERSFKDRATAKRDFENILNSLNSMNIREFAAMASKTRGKLATSPRKEMEKLAADPTRKLAPPKTHFPGDTVENRDQGINEPFGDEDGLQASPGARGELVFRAPGTIGVPLQPISPTVNSDDTKRRQEVPPIFRPDRGPLAESLMDIFTKTADDLLYTMPETEEWEKEQIPKEIISAWSIAHAALESTHFRKTEKMLFNAAKKAASLAQKSRKYLNPQVMSEIGEYLTKIENGLNAFDGLQGPAQTSSAEEITAYIDSIIDTVHQVVSAKLNVDPAAWYQEKHSAEEIGVFDTHVPASFDVKMPGPQRQLSGSYRTAVDFAPTPKARTEVNKNEPMLLQLPNDLRDKYSDLARRVTDYAKSVGGNLGALDAYKYRNSPPRDWVERELPNAKSDLEDVGAWGKYVTRHSHDEIADFADFGSVDPSTVSSSLHTEWAVSADEHDFNKWFRTSKPTIKKDESLVVFLRDRARSNPDHDISKNYDGWWRKRYLGKVYSQAYHLAKEKWQEYLKSSGTEFAKEEYKDALDLLTKLQHGEGIPTGDLIDALHSLPFENEYREDVESYKTELDGLVNEGMSSLDLASQPVSRDDRMFGDMVHEGFRWVPSERVIVGATGEDSTSSDLPVPLFQYGSRFYLVHAGDQKRVGEKSYVWADVTRIIPGSSIRKRCVASIEDFNRKSKLLAQAIYDVQNGQDREAVFQKYARAFGPGIRKAVDDYLYIQSMNHKAADEEYGDASGGGGCSTFWNDQTPDNCDGCTFNVGTGGPEFGYGGCLLTQLFLNAPDKGFGKGDEPAGYDQEHMPGKPSVQKR